MNVEEPLAFDKHPHTTAGSAPASRLPQIRLTCTEKASEPRGSSSKTENNNSTICRQAQYFRYKYPTSPLLPPRKVPLEDLIYTSCTDPIRQPAATRTPRLHQPSAVHSIVLRLCAKGYRHRV
ncbi:hypothetical protein F511_44504 [Dorcoceras hygrometricum]|uniref:Uncharacterized protein n=1 Tax=Dorcoceras hygrometricum TaxID=472368 RepID=A0A2Z7A5C6_9LAMI|nr:hypothetical protein F511_44504 [Dorcoceras hygrometricum]